MEQAETGVVQLMNTRTLADTDTFFVFSSEYDLLSQINKRFRAEEIIIENFSEVVNKTRCIFAVPSLYHKRGSGSSIVFTMYSDMNLVEYSDTLVDLSEFQ